VAVADISNLISESNETNNILIKHFDISAPPYVKTSLVAPDVAYVGDAPVLEAIAKNTENDSLSIRINLGIRNVATNQTINQTDYYVLGPGASQSNTFYKVTFVGTNETDTGVVDVNGERQKITKGTLQKFGKLPIYMDDVFYLSTTDQTQNSATLTVGYPGGNTTTMKGGESKVFTLGGKEFVFNKTGIYIAYAEFYDWGSYPVKPVFSETPITKMIRVYPAKPIITTVPSALHVADPAAIDILFDTTDTMSASVGENVTIRGVIMNLGSNTTEPLSVRLSYNNGTHDRLLQAQKVSNLTPGKEAVVSGSEIFKMPGNYVINLTIVGIFTDFGFIPMETITSGFDYNATNNKISKIFMVTEAQTTGTGQSTPSTTTENGIEKTPAGTEQTSQSQTSIVDTVVNGVGEFFNGIVGFILGE